MPRGQAVRPPGGAGIVITWLIIAWLAVSMVWLIYEEMKDDG